MALCADAAIGNVQEKAMKLHNGSNSEMVTFEFNTCRQHTKRNAFPLTHRRVFTGAVLVFHRLCVHPDGPALCGRAGAGSGLLLRGETYNCSCEYVALLLTLCCFLIYGVIYLLFLPASCEDIRLCILVLTYGLLWHLLCVGLDQALWRSGRSDRSEQLLLLSKL